MIIHMIRQQVQSLRQVVWEQNRLSCSHRLTQVLLRAQLLAWLPACLAAAVPARKLLAVLGAPI